MLTAKDIMTTDVTVAKPEMTVEQLASIFVEKNISGVPVVDDAGNVVGIVTESDLIDQKKKFHIPTMITLLDSVIFLDSEKKIEKEIKKMTGATVNDICTKDPVTITEDARLDEIASIMADKKIHTLPVVAEGVLKGIVGKGDVINSITRTEGEEKP